MVHAFIGIQIESGEYLGWQKSIMEKIASLDGVLEVHSTFGRFDLIARAEADDIDALNMIVNDYIRPVPGVLRTETFMITGHVSREE